MAQPKARRKLSPQKQELENLEKRSAMFVQKRNELNDLARQYREDRDLLNGRKREIFDRMKTLKAERDMFTEKVGAFKEQRNQFQSEAKSLIAKRRGDKKASRKAQSAPMRARELRMELRDLEYRQETNVLGAKEEEKVIKSIRAKRKELDQLQPELEKAAELDVDLSDTDQAIDTLFAKADEAHEQVVRFHKAGNEVHEKYVELVKEIKTLSAEADAKHELFIETRKKADAEHKKMLELREKILEIRGDERRSRAEARKLVKDHQKQVRAAVADPKKLDEAAEDALESLKKGGKIQFG